MVSLITLPFFQFQWHRRLTPDEQDTSELSASRLDYTERLYRIHHVRLTMFDIAISLYAKSGDESILWIGREIF